VKARISSEHVALLINAGGLAAVVVAIALGASGRRLGHAGGFLVVGTGASVYSEVASRVLARRARRRSDIDVPRGVRLGRPLWLSFADLLIMLALAAPFAAVAAGVSFTGVGAGILLTAGAMGLFAAVTGHLVVAPQPDVRGGRAARSPAARELPRALGRRHRRGPGRRRGPARVRARP
jgi:hypothetical protein